MDASQQNDTPTAAGSPPSITGVTPDPPALQLSDSAKKYKAALQNAISQVRDTEEKENRGLLKAVLSRWPPAVNGHKPLNHVYYVLENDYAEDQQPYHYLKPEDQNLINALEAVAEESEVRIFIALLWKIKEPGEEGAYDENNNEWGSHYIDHEDNIDGYEIESDEEVPYDEGIVMKYKVKQLSIVRGMLMLESMPVDEDYLLPPPPDSFREDAEEKADGSMTGYGGLVQNLQRYKWANAATTGTDGEALEKRNCERQQVLQFYARENKVDQSQAVVIVQREHVVPVLANAYNHQIGTKLVRGFVGSVDPQIWHWTHRIMVNGELGETVTMLKETCEYYWSRGGDPWLKNENFRDPLPRESIQAVLKAAVVLNDVEFFEKAAKDHQRHLPFEWFTWFRQYVQKQKRYESNVLVNEDEWLLRIKTFRKGLFIAVKDYHRYYEIRQALDRLTEDPGPMREKATSKFLRQWAEEIVHELFITDPPRLLDVQWNGISGYIDLTDFLADPPGCLRQNLLPLLKVEEATIPLILELSSDLKGRSIIKPQHKSQYQNLFQDVARLFLKNIDFVELDKSHHLIRLFADLFEIDAVMEGTLRELLLETLGALDASLFSAERLDDVWIPIAQALPTLLKKSDMPVTDPRCQNFVKGILTSYVNKYLGRRPDTTPSNVRPTVSCDCVDCEQVNAFLTDTERRMARFPLDDISREHVSMKLRVSKIDCDTNVLKVGPPHELMVRKTEKLMFEKTQEYGTRKRRVEEQIAKVPELQDLLGEEFDAILRLLQGTASI